MSFVFVSGRLALDFAGTRKWREDGPEEQLTTPADLRAWLRAAGVAGTAPAVDAEALVAAVDLREAIYRTATARRTGETPRRVDVRALNAAAAIAPPVPTLTADGRRARQRGDLAATLSVLARDAIDLLGGPDADRLRRCANPRCTRLFVDLSRAGTRRWCGMAECGNAAKVAAFRARHRS